MTVWEN